MIISDKQNIVILKNVPSNIVEQAIIVLKPNLNLNKKYQLDTIGATHGRTIPPTYAIDEARMVISDYIKNIESNQMSKKEKRLIKKYNRLMILTCLVTVGLLSIMFVKLF